MIDNETMYLAFLSSLIGIFITFFIIQLFKRIPLHQKINHKIFLFSGYFITGVAISLLLYSGFLSVHSSSGILEQLFYLSISFLIAFFTIAGFILLRSFDYLKQTEEELRYIQQDLQDTIREQQGMTFKYRKIYDQFIHTQCDGGLLYQLGFVPEQIIGKTLEDFLPIEVARVKELYYRRAWSGEANVTYEGESNGTTYLASLKPIRRDGRVVEVIASCIDITQRKRTEEELRATKEKLESFINYTADAIDVADLNGTVLQANKAFETIFGWSKEEILGRKLPIIPEDREREVELAIEEIRKGRHISGFETIRKRKDGSFINVSITVSPIRDQNGNTIAVAAITRDISEKKRMERKIKKSEARYRIIAENTTDVITVVDIKGTLIYASPSLYRILQLDPIGSEGSNIFSITNYHPDDLDKLHLKFREIIENKAPIGVEFRFANKQHHWIYLDARATPVIGANGEVEIIVIVSRDITEQRNTEELLRKSEKLSVIGQLAAGVAHEIRNPLTAIKGFIQLLKPDLEIRKDYYQIILSEFNRIESIISEFLFLAKPQSIQYKPNDVTLLLQDIIALLNSQAILNNAQIFTDFHENIPPVQSEANQLKQVFINILKNAIEAMPNGGDIRIEVQQADHRNVVIRFKDQGYGIPEERIPQLGEPFYSTKEKGTGLGLMICYRIIENHQGQIHIKSDVGLGTTVEIYLPI